jgi:hypothetical protein
VTARDVLDRLAYHGHPVRAVGRSLTVSGRVPARVRYVLRQHRRALLDALAGRGDVEIPQKLSARDRDLIGATHRIGDTYTLGDGDGPLIDLMLGFTTIDELADAHLDRLRRWHQFLGAMRCR